MRREWHDGEGVQHPSGTLQNMSNSATSKFTAAARVLAQRVGELGLVVPGFRTPPRIVGVNRSLRRSRDGEGGVVAVRIADRPFTATIGDMIEGVIVINCLTTAEADRVRTLLWRTMLQFTVESAAPRPSTRVA